MNWTKIDTNFHNNPKIIAAGPDAREVYLFVILMNAQQDADGEIAAHFVSPGYLAKQLQRDIGDVTIGLENCVTSQLLQVTPVTVTILGWDSDWRVKTSRDRTRKYRERKSASKPTQNEQNQPVALPCDVTERHRDDCDALEESRVEESRVDKVTSPRAPKFDFEYIYARYPKKAGKQAGMKSCSKQIRTADQFSVLAKAVAKMESAWRGKPKTYCPGWGPFINQQRYLDEDLPFPSSDSTPGGNAPKIKDLT